VIPHGAYSEPFVAILARSVPRLLNSSTKPPGNPTPAFTAAYVTYKLPPIHHHNNKGLTTRSPGPKFCVMF
jgi:hypothetical protein